jgi:anti-sigma regulatory factor (Ser/Thr protein kinase)
MHVDPPAQDSSSSAWALRQGRWSHRILRGVSFDCPGGPEAAGIARHRVLDELGELLDDEERDSLAVPISELVTNSVRHAGMTRASDVITVHAALSQDLIRIEVCDTGPGFTPDAPRVRNFADGSGGLGLVLLDRLARSWGVAKADDFCVWAEFERTEPPAAA